MTCSLGAGVGVDGVETAAACLRVLTLDICSYRSMFVGSPKCRVFARRNLKYLSEIKLLTRVVNSFGEGLKEVIQKNKVEGCITSSGGI